MTDRLDTEGKPGNKPGAQNDDTTQVTGTIDSRHLSSVVEQRFRKASLPSAESNTSDPAPVNAGFAARGCEMSADEALTEVGWGGAVLMKRPQLELAAFALRREVIKLRATLEAFSLGSRDLLSIGQLAEFDEQNELLTAEGEDPVTVAEYLKCRLDDASATIERVETLIGEADGDDDGIVVAELKAALRGEPC